jgi:hypothetical protein
MARGELIMNEEKEIKLVVRQYRPDEPEVDAVCDSRLESEELAAVIAPTLHLNHRDAYLAAPVQLEAEELEAVIAPGEKMNHNETLLAAPVELEAEELEAVIAPGIRVNHNEAFLYR